MPDAASATRALRNAAHFSSRLDHDARRHRPAGNGFAHLRGDDAARSAITSSIGPTARQDARSFRRNMPRKAADLARPAARQRQHQRRIGRAPARLVSIGPQFANALDQRMADIAARRPAQLGMDGRLERQDRQHLIDIGRAWRAPGRVATPKPTAKHSRGSELTATAAAPGAPPDG